MIYVRSHGFFENVKVEKWLKNSWQMLLMANILFDDRNHKQNSSGKYYIEHAQATPSGAITLNLVFDSLKSEYLKVFL